MARIVDRVVETTQTTGTGTIDLLGAQAGYLTFGSGLDSSDQVYYLIEDDPLAPSEWEFGVGTWTDGSPDTLSRDTVVRSSNNGNRISLQAGQTYVVTGTLSREYFGTAATEDIQTSPDDTTPGRLMRVGAFGLNNNLGTAAFKDVGDQPDHDAPSGVEKLARLDRLYAAPGWQHIETRNITSPVSAIDFNIPSEFNSIKFSVTNFTRNGSVKLACRFSFDGGSTFLSGATDYQIGLVFTGPAGGSASDSKIELSNTAQGTNTNGVGVDGNYYLYPAGPSGLQSRMHGTYICLSLSDSEMRVGVAGGRRTGSGRVSAVRFYNAEGSGDNIGAGLFVMEGARSS